MTQLKKTAGSPHVRKEKQKRIGTLFTVPVIISLCILTAIVLCCILAPVISPYSPNEQDISAALSPPGDDHLLGADQVGRDLMTRLFYGGRTTILGSLGIVALSLILSLPLGLLAGYLGGKTDSLIMRVCDILLAFPTLLLAFLFVAGFGRGLGNAMIALGIVYVPTLIRLTRSIAMVEKSKVYVEALQSMGYSGARIMFIHILPNCMSSIVVQVTLDLGYAVLDLAGMSFLGLGVQPPTADWGAMLNEGRNFLLQSPLLALAPGLAIILLVVSINIFSDGLYRYLEPGQRKLPSFRKYDKWLRKEAARHVEAVGN